MYIYITIQYYIFAFLVCNMTYDVLELEDTWKAPELVDSSCDFGSLDDIPCLPSLQGQSDDHQNSLERFDGTIEGRTSQSHGSWIMSHEAINDCISWKEEIEKSKQRHNTLQDQFREASACLSVTLAYARPWPHSLRELKAKMTKHLFLCVWCVLHDDGFLMLFAASLNLMICTATICNSFGDVLGGDSMGFPSFWTNPGSCTFSAGTEFLREIATLRDEARVRGDPEKFLGQGSLDHSLSTGASEALGMFSCGKAKNFQPPKNGEANRQPTGERTKNTIVTILDPFGDGLLLGVPHKLLR